VHIASSNILMSSTRSYASRQQTEVRPRVRESDGRSDLATLAQGILTTAAGGISRDFLALSAGASSAAPASIEAPSTTAPSHPFDVLSPQDEAKLRMLETLMAQVTGKKIRFKTLRCEDFAQAPHAQGPAVQLQQVAREAQATRQVTPRADVPVEYERITQSQEAERTTFASAGLVHTADGQQIAVSVDVTMSRAFVARHAAHLRLDEIVRKDPLVMNFGGNAAQLTTTTFSFDIDTDGTEDQIAFLQPGAGFLAIDTNGDGSIKNGKELFGPTTGDGFAELGAYDSDGNHWIDAGDPVFSRLRIWSKDAAGTDQLLALGQAGVGAIYLGNVATPFSVNTADNRQLGVVQSTGIWLGETGGAGTVQHVDLVV
jgi:hypothetical protein